MPPNSAKPSADSLALHRAILANNAPEALRLLASNKELVEAPVDIYMFRNEDFEYKFSVAKTSIRQFDCVACGPFSPLHSAVAARSPATVKHLLDTCNADIEAKISGSAYRPLHIAAMLGDDEIMEILLAHKANPNAKTPEMLQTPLHHLSASRGNILLCGYMLLNAGAEVDSPDVRNATPLSRICQQCTRPDAANVAALLLENGADPNSVEATELGVTPLFGAVLCRKCKVLLRKCELIDVLLDHGADIHHRLGNGDVGLLEMAHPDKRLIRHLIDKGALRGPRADARNLLMTTICEQSLDVLKWMLEVQPDLGNLVLENNLTGLQVAFMKGNCDLVSALATPDNVNLVYVAVTDGLELTPLMMAVGNKSERMVRELLELGADPRKATASYPQPWVMASRLGNRRLAQILLDAVKEWDARDEEVRAAEAKEAEETRRSEEENTVVVANICGNPNCRATKRKEEGGEEKKLKLCSGCKSVRYCSTDCGKLHWQEHQQACSAAAAAAAGGGSCK